MDLFKKKITPTADSWDWNCPKYVKRCKGDTQKLHKMARAKIKKELKKTLDKNNYL